MKSLAHPEYQIAVKALMWHEDRLLVLDSPDGTIDFPGGRIDANEQDMTWQQSLRREIAEELGDDVTYEIGSLAFASKRSYTDENKLFRIAVLFYNATFLNGDIIISDEHTAYRWRLPHEVAQETSRFVHQSEHQEFNSYIERIGTI